jgi:fluoride exporter
MQNSLPWFLIAIGGALGSVARFAAVAYLSPLLNCRFPIGTFIVNLLGSFLIGLAYVVIVDKTLVPNEWRFFIMTGVLGGFTTFSSFSLEMLQAWQEGQILLSIFYSASSVVFGLLFAYAGMQLAQKIF